MGFHRKHTKNIELSSSMVVDAKKDATHTHTHADASALKWDESVAQNVSAVHSAKTRKTQLKI